VKFVGISEKLMPDCPWFGNLFNKFFSRN